MQAFQGVEPVDTLGIDREPFAPKKHVNAAISVADADGRNRLDPFEKCGVERAALCAIVLTRSTELDHLARSASAHAVALLEVADAAALLCRLQSFFEMMSCSMVLSSERSATRRLSLLFSS